MTHSFYKRSKRTATHFPTQFLVFCLIWTMSAPLFAQTNGGQIPASLDLDKKRHSAAISNALRFLDSRWEQDLAWSESEFQELFVQGVQPSPVALTMAVLQFNQGKYAEALQTLEQATKAPGVNNEIRSLSGSMQLYSAVNLEDKANAERLFQALAEATLRDSIAIQDRRRYATILGELIGLLESPPARSCIDLGMLEKTKGDITRCGVITIEQSFKSAYGVSSTRAEQLNKLIVELQATGVEELEKRLAEGEKLLRDKQAETQTQKSSVNDARDANKEAAKKIRLDIRNIEGMIREIAAELKLVTPGHPGRIIPLPIRPVLQRIPVDEYETIVTVDRNGRNTTIIQRRPQWEIDQDRALQFQLLMVEYDRNVQLHNQYQTNLARWENNDRKRRADLTDRRLRLQEELRILKESLERLNEADKVVADGYKEVRGEEKELSADLIVLSEFIDAVHQGHPERAYRPLRLRSEELGYMKTRLTKLLQ